MNPNLEKTFTDRLVTLSDGRPGLRGALAVTATQSSLHAPDAPVLDFVASDDTIDRYSEVIDPAGWDLENYRRNPVFQNSHKYGDVAFTLGKALITDVRGGKLMQRVQFATDVNPMAKVAHGLYKGGFLSAVSVGFIPLKWEDNPLGKSADHRISRKYLQQELLEVSAVAVPANPNALVMGLKSGAIEASDLDDLLGFIAGMLTAPNPQFRFLQQRADPNSNTRDLGAGVDESQLLQLARDLKTILKAA